MRQSQRVLLALIEQIFEDGLVTAEERSDLVSLYARDGLSVAEVQEVFAAFVTATWGDVIVDGVISTDERALLSTIVRELRLPPEQLPRAVRDVIDEAA